MKKIVKKSAKVVKPMSKQMAFMLTEKLELKVKRVMRQMKLKSTSAAIRACIEAY